MIGRIAMSAALVLGGLAIFSGTAGAAHRPRDGQPQGPDDSGRAVSFAYTTVDDMPHGLAADERLVFVAMPLAHKVSVLDRFTGSEVAELPPPPGGFGLPFIVRIPHPGRLVMLDSGGFPNPVVPSIPSVLVYRYHYDAGRRRLDATLEKTIRFDGVPVVFAEDLVVLRPDLYAVSESVLGALWLVHGDGTITAGIAPDDFSRPLPALGGCPFPAIDIGGVPFAPGFAPGVGSLATHRGQLYFTNSCRGGLYEVPISTLLDESRSPSARAADIETVSPEPAGTVEALEGLAFRSEGQDDPWVYAGDSFHLRLIRINVETGERQVVGDDPSLFNFPVGLAWEPTLLGTQTLLVTSDQEYRLAALNPGISEDELQPPFTITEVVPRAPRGSESMGAPGSRPGGR